jgi:hypothetical protein
LYVKEMGHNWSQETLLQKPQKWENCNEIINKRNAN